MSGARLWTNPRRSSRSFLQRFARASGNERIDSVLIGIGSGSSFAAVSCGCSLTAISALNPINWSSTATRAESHPSANLTTEEHSTSMSQTPRGWCCMHLRAVRLLASMSSTSNRCATWTASPRDSFPLVRSRLSEPCPSLRNPRFFNCWTRKEAYLKATGEGISESLPRVEVTLMPGDAPRLLSLAGDGLVAAEWTFILSNPRGGLGALAIKATGLRLSCWRWPEN